MSFLISYIIIPLFVLGLLVYIHEFGHFIVARLFGVGVETFSLGFGPRLFGIKSGITDYRVSAIPLGGYVKMVGDEPDEDIDPELIPLSFTHKHVIKRFLIVAAGPVFNYVLGIVIFSIIALAFGETYYDPIIGRIAKSTPAEKAGIKPGDRITAIDEIVVNTWDDLREIVRTCNGETLKFSIKRGESNFIVNITPHKIVRKNIFNEDETTFQIGVELSTKGRHSKEISVSDSISKGFDSTVYIIKNTFVGTVKMFQGKIAVKDNLGGPFKIAKIAGDFYSKGFLELIWFMASLSIILAVLNLLPIPVLDGGHLLFYFMEAIKGSPVNDKMRMISQQVGLVLLMSLMLFALYVDITSIFF